MVLGARPPGPPPALGTCAGRTGGPGSCAARGCEVSVLRQPLLAPPARRGLLRRVHDPCPPSRARGGREAPVTTAATPAQAVGRSRLTACSAGRASAPRPGPARSSRAHAGGSTPCFPSLGTPGRGLTGRGSPTRTPRALGAPGPGGAASVHGAPGGPAGPWRGAGGRGRARGARAGSGAGATCRRRGARARRRGAPALLPEGVPDEVVPVRRPVARAVPAARRPVTHGAEAARPALRRADRVPARVRRDQGPRRPATPPVSRVLLRRPVAPPLAGAAHADQGPRRGRAPRRQTGRVGPRPAPEARGLDARAHVEVPVGADQDRDRLRGAVEVGREDAAPARGSGLGARAGRAVPPRARREAAAGGRAGAGPGRRGPAPADAPARLNVAVAVAGDDLRRRPRPTRGPASPGAPPPDTGRDRPAGALPRRPAFGLAVGVRLRRPVARRRPGRVGRGGVGPVQGPEDGDVGAADRVGGRRRPDQETP